MTHVCKESDVPQRLEKNWWYRRFFQNKVTLYQRENWNFAVNIFLILS